MMVKIHVISDEELALTKERRRIANEAAREAVRRAGVRVDPRIAQMRRAIARENAAMCAKTRD